MPYVGNSPASNFASVTKDTFSGNGSTTAFTLSKTGTTNGVAVFVENVRQIPTTAYAVSGTTLTFTAAPVSGTNNIYVLHHNTPASTATHPASQALTATSGTFTGNVTHSGTVTFGSTVSGLDVNGTEIILDADGDSSIHSSTDDQIDIKVGNVDKVIVTGNGDISLGGNTPNTYSGYTALTIGGSASTTGSTIDFEDSDGNRDAQVYANANYLYLSNIDVNVETGDLIFGTAGKGIVLGTTSNTDANTLDDYEEGTFTPSADGYSGTMTFTTANYVKVGRQVTIAFKMTGDGTSDSSTVAISGFPFAVQSEHPAALSYSTASNANLHATSNPIPNAMVNTAEIMYFYMPEGTGFTYTNLGSGYIRVACTYLTTG